MVIDQRQELERALAHVESEGSGPGDRFHDLISQALRTNAVRDVNRALTIFRDYVSACCWIYSDVPNKEPTHGSEAQAHRRTATQGNLWR